MSTTNHGARVALGTLAARLTVEQLRQTTGGHVYGGFLPIIFCKRRRLHLGFFNARRLFGSVCRRIPLRFGFNTV